MKKKILLSAICTIALCVSLITGATFALFTDQAEVNVAVTSGTVSVTAEVDQASLKTYSFDVEQAAGTFENGGSASFTGTADLELNLMSPGDKAEFVIKVNNASNINTKYQVAMKAEGELTPALVATANIEGFDYKITSTANTTPWRLVAANEAINDIKVTVSFPDAANNNDYMGKSATLTFTVNAVQGNAPGQDMEVPVASTTTEVKEAIAEGKKLIYIEGEVDLAGVSIGAGTEFVGAGEGSKIIATGAMGIHGAIKCSNLTIVRSNENYRGFQHTTTEIYENCVFEGQPFLYGENVTLNNCTFKQTSADAYNVWTYGAHNVTFNNCKFYSAGKSVLIYKETDSRTFTNNFNNCEFYASAPVDGKAAIEIDSSLVGKYIVNINDCTAFGFANGSVSGNALWNVKKEKSPSNAEVTVNNSFGYTAALTTVSTAAELKTALLEKDINNVYVRLENDIDLAGVDWLVVSDRKVFGGKMFVLDGNGYTVSNLTQENANNKAGLFPRFYSNGNVTVKDLTLDGFTLSGNNTGEESAGGALFGWLETHGNSASISNVTVTNAKVSDFKYVGGLIGYAADHAVNLDGCTVDTCDLDSTYCEGTSFKGHIGGIIGHYYNGTISNCTVKAVTIDVNETAGATDAGRRGALAGTLQADAVIGAGNVCTSVTIEGAAADRYVGSVDNRTDKSGTVTFN